MPAGVSTAIRSSRANGSSAKFIGCSYSGSAGAGSGIAAGSGAVFAGAGLLLDIRVGNSISGVVAGFGSGIESADCSFPAGAGFLPVSIPYNSCAFLATSESSGLPVPRTGYSSLLCYA